MSITATRYNSEGTYLPGPEEPIAESIHTCLREVQQSSLCVVIPKARIREERAIRRSTSTTPNTIDEQAAVVNRITELARDRDTECLARLVKRGAPAVARCERPLATELRSVTVGGGVDGLAVWLTVEREVGVGIEHDTVAAGEEASPRCDAEETVVEGDERSVACAYTSDATNHVVGVQVASITRKCQRDNVF